MKVIFAIIGMLVTNGYPNVAALDPNQLYCVAKAVYVEARGEDEQGRNAVAWGIRHRMESGDFPKNACDVIYQVNDRGIPQFSNISDIKVKEGSKDWNEASIAAVFVFAGIIPDPIAGKRFWYAHNKVPEPRGSKRIRTKVAIGNHTFYDYSS